MIASNLRFNLIILLFINVLDVFSCRGVFNDSESTALDNPKKRNDTSGYYESDIHEKREHVRNMMQGAWNAYVESAWSYDEVRPVSKSIHDRHGFRVPMGTSIVDSIDTLFLMGFKDEYYKSRKWIEDNLDFDLVEDDVSVFETNIRFVGGLLSIYALTGDVMFKKKAVQIADKLLPAFESESGLPYGTVYTKSGIPNRSNGIINIAEFGTLSMEFNYLSDITGDPKYTNKVKHIQRIVNTYNENGEHECSFPMYWDPRNGTPTVSYTSLGAGGDSFFEYLIKEWRRSGHRDRQVKDMFSKATTELADQVLRKTTNGLTYVMSNLENNMEHLACFSGGMYGLAGYDARHSSDLEESLKNTVRNYHQMLIRIGAEITEVCHESYIATGTKLGPETFFLDDQVASKTVTIHRSGHNQYLLRPETVESYFVMWRVTHDQKYRDWGWEVLQAIEKHCRTSSGGYSGINDVWSKYPGKDDLQQSWFLAETLKYLYLLFSNDNVLSLDEWVFNTEAHPLPIKGRNILYRGYEK